MEISVNLKLKTNDISFENTEVVFSSEGALYNGFCFSPSSTFVAILEWYVYFPRYINGRFIFYVTAFLACACSYDGIGVHNKVDRI